jgi:hypothetical protein
VQVIPGGHARSENPATGPTRSDPTLVGDEGAVPAAVRAAPPLGALFGVVRSPDVEPFERLYRVLPEDGMFSPLRSPSNPFVAEIGAYKVADDKQLLITAYEFRVFGFGVYGTSDAVEYPDNSFSTILSWDLSVQNTQSQRDTQYAIDPIPISSTSNQFQQGVFTGLKNPPPPSYFNANASRAFSSPSAGTAVLPNRAARLGPPNGPFTLYVENNQAIAGKVNLTAAFPAPIAFLQFGIQGYLFDKLTLNPLLKLVGVR